MYIIFFKGKGFISRAIQLQTRSKYSHVAIIIGGDMYEAWHKGGVRKNREVDITSADMYSVKPSIANQEETIKRFLEFKLGAPYDFSSVARFISRRPAKENGKYFCSELIMDAFKEAGIYLLHAYSHDVSPRDLAMSPLLTRTQ